MTFSEDRVVGTARTEESEDKVQAGQAPALLLDHAIEHNDRIAREKTGFSFSPGGNMNSGHGSVIRIKRISSFCFFEFSK